MAFRFSARSRSRMQGVHPDLIRVAERAIVLTEVDFMITEGLRTPARQAELVKAGASRTLNSRHLTGHAIDVAAMIGSEVRWDWPLYPRIAKAFKQASKELAIPIIWGGDWPRLRDGPHFELDRKVYP
jgi:peptidoglycan LD-endopeptidase CwlK